MSIKQAKVGNQDHRNQRQHNGGMRMAIIFASVWGRGERRAG
jgi:hypothetical protein